jgi:site-specific recombinase XerD
MKTNVLKLGNLIDGFKLSCQTEGKSSKTIEWYISFLERFHRFLEDNGLPVSINLLEKNHVRKFIRYLQQEARTPRSNKPLSGATVQGYVRTLKAFFAWVEREEYIPANLMVKIPLPKTEVKVITTFSEVQIQRLFNLCLASNGHSIRNMVIH